MCDNVNFQSVSLCQHPLAPIEELVRSEAYNYNALENLESVLKWNQFSILTNRIVIDTINLIDFGDIKMMMVSWCKKHFLVLPRYFSLILSFDF